MTCHCGQAIIPKCLEDEGMEDHIGRCCDCFDSTLPGQRENLPWFCDECWEAAG